MLMHLPKRSKIKLKKIQLTHLPFDIINGMSPDRTLHPQRIPGHHGHITHGPDEGRPEHIHPAAVHGLPHVVGSSALVLAPVLRAHRRDVHVAHHLRRVPASTHVVPESVAGALRDGPGVQGPSDLGQRVALGHAFQGDGRPWLQSLLREGFEEGRGVIWKKLKGVLGDEE